VHFRTLATLFWLVPAAGTLAAQHADHEQEARPAPGPTLRINGFADVRYVSSDPAGRTEGFGLGQFDLFMRSQLGDRLGMLAELVITPRPANQFRLTLERLLVQFEPSDLLNLSIGRFHTSVGYFNATYHHGTWFQAAVDRPLIFAFEGDGGVLPIHTLGLSAMGRIPSGRWGLRYIIEAGNGRASEASPAVAPQPAIHATNGKAVNAGLAIRPEWAEGLQLGVSAYRDRITPDTLPPLTELILAAHALWQSSSLQWLNEALLIRHTPDGGGRQDSRGFYSQLAVTLGSWRPYVRYDYVDVPAADPLFAHLGRREGPAFGLRYDVDQFAALKAQYTIRRETLNPDAKRFEMQLAITF